MLFVFSLAHETNIERLRQAALLLERENLKFVKQITALTRELALAKGEDRVQLELKIAALEHELSVKNKLLFSPSSERSPKTPKDAQAKKPQTGHGPKKQPDLPLNIIEHELDEADKECPGCGGGLEEWTGQFEDSEEIDVLTRQFVLKKHRRKKYRCSCGHIETALGPKKLFDGARYSIDFAIEVASDKFLDHLPLERQVRRMQREGLDVESQTLWDQTLALAKLLSPAMQRLHDYTLSHGVLGADETTWWKMRGRGEGAGASEKWWLWTVVCPNAVHYRLDPRRSAEAAKELLQDYGGILMCDGHGAYTKHAKSIGITIAQCWSHVRREYMESAYLDPPEVEKALVWINTLFEIEREANTGPPEDRLKVRQEQSKLLTDKIRDWAEAQIKRVLPESALGKAIGYMMNRWEELTLFLSDARIPLHNNASERALRGPVVGRKNFRGCRSKRGMEVAATFYSLLESAKLCGVNPKQYLRQAVEAALDGCTIPLPHELLIAAA
jgi:transposase